MVGCKHEIKTHCQEHTEPNGILNCLKVSSQMLSDDASVSLKFYYLNFQLTGVCMEEANIIKVKLPIFRCTWSLASYNFTV